MRRKDKYPDVLKQLRETFMTHGRLQTISQFEMRQEYIP
jgi:hypothetical protein